MPVMTICRHKGPDKMVCELQLYHEGDHRYMLTRRGQPHWKTWPDEPMIWEDWWS